MSVAEGLPEPFAPVERAAKEPRREALPALCPYLATLDGNWRSANAVREHRCMAVSPPVQLAAEKQRRLCLVDRHVDCATYGAAVAAHAGTGSRLAAPLRPVARMTPVILDHGRFDLRLPTWRADRASGQAALVGVLGLAFVAILLARPSGDAGTVAPRGSSDAASAGASDGMPIDAAAASPSAGPADTMTPEETARATATGTSPTATEATPTASAPPASEPVPSQASSEPVTSGATYKVKSGDTLSAIAARFGTTTRVLVRLNGIADPSRLKVGQVLKLP